MNSDLGHLIRKNSAYVLSGKLVTPGITFLVTVYIVRTLSVSDYGTYNILLAVMSYIALLSGLGLPSIFQRYIPEFREQEKTANLKTLIVRGLLWRAMLASGLITCVILFSAQLSGLLKIEGYLNYFVIFSLAIIFSLEIQLLSISLTALFLHKYFVISIVFHTLLRAGIVYFFLESGWELKGLLLAESIAFGFAFIMQFYWCYKKFFAVYPGQRRQDFPFRRLARFGAFSYFNEIGEQILDVSTDFFVISTVLGPQMVGLYAFANQIVTLLSRGMPHRMLMDVISPTFFTRYSQTKDPTELNVMFNILAKLIAFFVFPFVAGIFVLGDKLVIYVFDPKYLEALSILWIVAGFSAVNSFAYPLGLVVQSIEKVEIHLFSKIFSVYNLVGALLVIRPFGVVGVAAVTSSAVFFKNLFTYLFAKRYVSFSFDVKALFVIGLNSAISAFSLYLLRGLVVDVFSFLLVVLAGGLVYLLVAYLNKGFSPDERRILNRAITKPVFVF